MKILFVLENYYPNIGGVETLFKSLIENLVITGSEVVVLTNKIDRSSPYVESLSNCIIYRLPFFNRYIFTFFAWFPAAILSYRCDLIQTTSYNAGVPAYIAGLFMRKKVVITFHEVWSSLWFELPFISQIGASLHYLFERLLLKLNFTKFVAVSDYTKKSLINAGIPNEKVLRIYNGINYDNKSKAVSSPKKSFKFFYFGRIGISKGLDVLLNAVKIFREREEGFELVLVIPTKPKKFYNLLLKMIQQFKIDDVITIKSNLSRESLDSEIVNSNAVIIPSYSEGFCFAAVETIELGTPIISSNKGALQEVISGKYIAMKELTAIGLADAMQLALDDGWETKPVKKFHLDDTIRAYQELYQELSI